MSYGKATRTQRNDSVLVPATNIMTDRNAAIAMASRVESIHHTKNIDLKFLQVRDLMQLGIIRLKKIRSGNQISGEVVKIPTSLPLERMITHLGLEILICSFLLA